MLVTQKKNQTRADTEYAWIDETRYTVNRVFFFFPAAGEFIIGYVQNAYQMLLVASDALYDSSISFEIIVKLVHLNFSRYFFRSFLKQTIRKISQIN